MLTRIPPSRGLASSFPLLFALAAAATTAQAAVTFEQQLRTVSTFAIVDFHEGEDPITQDLFQTEETGQFEGLAQCQAGVPGDQATATAGQLSYIEPALLLAEGNFNAQAEIGELADFAEALGEARYSSVFSVDEPTEVELLATLIATGNGRVNLIFRVLDGEIFVYRALFDGTEDIEETRTLPPGTYELTAQTSGFGQAFEGGGEPAFGSFGLSLRFPGTADVAPGTPGLAARIAPVVAPNPVRGETRILPPASAAAGRSELTILDLSGRTVRRYLDVPQTGVTWDTRDDAGRPVAAGMYLIQGGAGGSTRAVVLR
jgi:hypothetical protein